MEAAMSETALQADIVKALKAYGCRVHVNVVVKKRGRATGAGAGSPDLLVAIAGARANSRRPEYVWLEIKTDEGRRSPGQVEWHTDADRFGERVATVRSVLEAIAVVQAIRFGRAA
jgi:hypothetical protein